MCTSALGNLRRADKTSNAQLPFSEFQPLISLINLAQQGIIGCQKAVPEASNTAKLVGIQGLAMMPAKSCTIWFEALVILPMWPWVMPKFIILHILKRSAIVMKHWWVGAKGHDFGLVRIQR